MHTSSRRGAKLPATALASQSSCMPYSRLPQPAEQPVRGAHCCLDVAASQSTSQKATQKLSLPVSTSEVPSGCHAAPLARKPDSGMCTQDAPSGVHRYSLGSPVHSTRRLEAGHQAAERTGRAWTSRLASASERVSHTHTACGMESQRVAMKLPSWLHATLPAGGGAVGWGGQGAVVNRMQRLAGTW